VRREETKIKRKYGHKKEEKGCENRKKREKTVSASCTEEPNTLIQI
jgi:hypothetical protein